MSFEEFERRVFNNQNTMDTNNHTITREVPMWGRGDGTLVFIHEMRDDEIWDAIKEGKADSAIEVEAVKRGIPINYVQ